MKTVSPTCSSGRKPACRRRGFSLVEVTAALGIVTTTLLLLVGLVPTGVQSNTDTFEETQAANLASLIIADVRGGNGTPTPMFGIQYASPDPAASTSVTYYFSETFDADKDLDSHTTGLSSRYRADLTFNQASSDDMAPPLEVNLTISWPAQLDPTVSADQRALNGTYSTFFTVPNPDAYEN